VTNVARSESSPLTFDEYLRRSADALLRHATIVTADPQQAQDIVQTVLERAYRGWDRIGSLDHPHAYLRRMVVNEFISFRRRMARIFLTAAVPEPDRPPDHADQYAERSALIERIRRLPNRQRAAVALRYWDGLTDAEIAAELGCSPGSVRGYISRGLRTLRLEAEDPQRAARRGDMDGTGTAAVAAINTKRELG
jgi:RNA polymerase sigma-70 factor (sigma-E family)